MNTSDIIDGYETRFQKLSKFYNKALEDFQANDIHLFRVEMKKLRAFIRLINLTVPGKQHKIPKPLKSFYHIAGNIRNLQLHELRIVNLSNDLFIQSPTSYLQFLQDEEKSMKKKARQTADDISLKDFEKKLIKESPDQLSKEIKNVFVQKRKQRLEELLTLPFYYDEGLHEVRKILKDLMYDYKYLENTIVAKLPSGINQVKAMRTLTTALGDFHDLCVALFLVSAVYIDRMENTDEIEIISDLKAQLQLRKEDMKTEIITRLQPLKQQVDKEKSLIQMYEVLN